MPCQYPPEFQQRAVRMVDEVLPDHATDFEAIKKVSYRLGVSPEACAVCGAKSKLMLGCGQG